MSCLADAPLSGREVADTYDPSEEQPQSFAWVWHLPRPRLLAELDQAAWYPEVASRLAELMRLPRDWDSYGGVAVNQRSAARALWFLSRSLERDSDAPWVVPLGDGGVQLEWHRPGFDVEIVFSESGNEATVFDEARGIEWEGDPEAARSVLNAVVSSLRSTP